MLLSATAICGSLARSVLFAVVFLVFTFAVAPAIIIEEREDGASVRFSLTNAGDSYDNQETTAVNLEDDQQQEQDNSLSEMVTLPATNTAETPHVEQDDEQDHSAEHHLYNYLLQTRYQKHVRPVRRHNKPITVKVGMCVMMIEDIVERDQVMIMASCVKMIWHDDFLEWNPEKFEGISWIAVSSDKIWLPDIAIVNSPEPHSLTRKLTNVDVSSDGGVGYYPSGRLVTRCNVMIAYFPFDRQNCEVRFESWIYPSQYLEIEPYPGEEVDIKEYYVNLHWTILGYRALPEKVDYDGKNFSCITFVFSLRRKPAFYFMYYIFPEVMLALLQALSHTLPVEHPGRMTMLTALFIGSSVTHSGIAAHIPKSSDSMSLLQIYMIIVSVNLVFSLVNSFVMLYTVLRFPEEEPSLLAMFSSFFSIIWPEWRHSDSPSLYEKCCYPMITSSKKRSKPSRNVELADEYKKSKQSEDTWRNFDHQDRHLLTPILPELTSSSYDNVPNGELKMPSNCSSVTDNSSSHNFLHVADKPNFERQLFKSLVMSDTWKMDPSTSLHQSLGSGFLIKKDELQGTDLLRQSPSTQRKDYRNNSINAQSRSITGSPNISRNNTNQPIMQREVLMRKRNSPILGNSTARQENCEQHISGATGIPSCSSTLTVRPHRLFVATGNLLNKSKSNSESPHRSGKAEFDTENPVNEALKQRWLVYCVALDKCMMYVNGIWNLIIPITLFAIIPWLNDVMELDSLS